LRGRTFQSALPGLLVALAVGCTSDVGVTPLNSGVGAAGPGGVGGSGAAATGATGAGAAGVGGAGVGGAGVGGTSAIVDPLEGVGGRTQLRLLTQAEYRNSMEALLPGAVTDDLDLPNDLSVAGFVTVGASEVTVGELAAENYETSSRALVARLFADEQAWQAFVGCSPQPDLSDACVDTYIRSFGRRAFRRDLTEEEVVRWTTVARNAAILAEDPVHGLSTATSGMLQSPFFLYRVESAVPDPAIGRIRFDGLSMATRLSYLLTGSTPSDALLDAAAQGQLDTADGIRTAAAGLVQQQGAVEYMAEYFMELARLEHVLDAEKDSEAFPELDEALRASMLAEAHAWLNQVVLGQGADMRSFFDGTTTFVDGPLADLYGIQAPQGGGFGQVELGPESGRAGILGKASFLLAHSSPDSSNPTRRGYFILQNFLCLTVPPPPPGVNTNVEPDPNAGPQTTRQLFEAHLIDATCAGCHQAMDPFGFALEHFDPIGRYRADENGLPIDASGEFNGLVWDGALELGQVLRNDAGSGPCMIKNFYRYANGTPDDMTDAALVTELAGTLAERGYVWRDLLIDFVASNAFNSIAPTAPE